MKISEWLTEWNQGKRQLKFLIAQCCCGEIEGLPCGMWPTHDWEAVEGLFPHYLTIWPKTESCPTPGKANYQDINNARLLLQYLFASSSKEISNISPSQWHTQSKRGKRKSHLENPCYQVISIRILFIQLDHSSWCHWKQCILAKLKQLLNTKTKARVTVCSQNSTSHLCPVFTS